MQYSEEPAKNPETDTASNVVATSSPSVVAEVTQSPQQTQAPLTYKLPKLPFKLPSGTLYPIHGVEVPDTRWVYGLRGKVKMVEKGEIKEGERVPSRRITFTEKGMISELVRYDKDGQVKSVSTHRYDEQGRRIQEINSLPNGAVDSKSEWEYNQNGELRRQEYTSSDSGGYYVIYSYNPDGSLQMTTSDGKESSGKSGTKTDYKYENGKLVETAEYENGKLGETAEKRVYSDGATSRSSYHYNEQGYLKQFISESKDFQGVPRAESWTYTYGRNGLISQMEQKFAGEHSERALDKNLSRFNSNGDEVTFTSIEEGQLQNEIVKEYQYDSEGNWTQRENTLSERIRRLKKDDPNFQNAKGLTYYQVLVYY